jgi:hypothetical protein
MKLLTLQSRITGNTQVQILKAGVPASFIRDYVVSSGLSFAEAKRRAVELSKFLFVCSETADPLVPSPAVDDIWHDFILHTKDYAAFCALNFGKFIHHNPKRGVNPVPTDGYARTLEALRAGFAPIDTYIWPDSSAFFAEVCNEDPGPPCEGDQ